MLTEAGTIIDGGGGGGGIAGNIIRPFIMLGSNGGIKLGIGGGGGNRSSCCCTAPKVPAPITGRTPGPDPDISASNLKIKGAIKGVENIIQLLSEPSRVHPAFICLIKSKLGGVAIDAIAYEESLITWESIKNALIRRLGEPRNEI
ncbi:unnamed protein product [Leptidea sinapis]|uniref:Uncharacterized protein n=1 Tax=Leptidea sinapis TaxID=189913 RepID=A0A5E4QEC2_9NEOP|nr:unnamed protein product [Leptidea sinapis]